MNRTEPLNLRLTKEEKSYLSELATLDRVSMSDLVRRAVFSVFPVRPGYNPDGIYVLRRADGQMGIWS